MNMALVKIITNPSELTNMEIIIIDEKIGTPKLPKRFDDLVISPVLNVKDRLLY